MKFRLGHGLTRTQFGRVFEALLIPDLETTEIPDCPLVIKVVDRARYAEMGRDARLEAAILRYLCGDTVDASLARMPTSGTGGATLLEQVEPLFQIPCILRLSPDSGHQPAHAMAVRYLAVEEGVAILDAHMPDDFVMATLREGGRPASLEVILPDRQRLHVGGRLKAARAVDGRLRIALRVDSCRVADSDSYLPEEAQELLDSAGRASADRAGMVPTVLDAWTSSDGRFALMAMERAGNGTLADAVDRGDRFERAGAWGLLEGLLEALVLLERNGVRHGNIHPGNVLLNGRGGFVLTGFGSARFREDRSHDAVPVYRVAQFAAPEIRDTAVGRPNRASDIWSVGTVVRALMDPTDKDADLEQVLVSMTHENPGMRQNSALDLLNDVRAHQNRATVGSQTGSFISSGSVARLDKEIADPLWRRIRREAPQRAFPVTFQAGEELCTQGEMGFWVFVLLIGKVVIESDGRELYREGREGSVLGETSAVLGTPRVATIRAVEPVTALMIRPEDFEWLVIKYPPLGLRMIRLLCERLLIERRNA